jgi:peptidoglycan/xylan/chitin deacetylase (PgdA/CDA1 family)
MTRITLSFDNGPDPSVTPAVLETLARHDIAATFFVVGKHLETSEGQSLMAAAHAQGHWIGNHTYTHTVSLGRMAQPAEAIAEIERTTARIGACAHPSRLFRPFGNGGILDQRLLSTAVVDHLCDNGYSCVVWNAVPRDWENPDGWVDVALRQTAAQGEALLVLHDIPTGAMQRLDEFIERAKRAGAEFRQEFPERCKLIWEGRRAPNLAAFVTS